MKQIAYILLLLSAVACTKSSLKTSPAVNADAIVPNEFLVQLCTVNGAAPNIVVDSLSINGAMYNDGGQTNYNINISAANGATIIVYGHASYTYIAPAATCYYTATPAGGSVTSYSSQLIQLQDGGMIYTLSNIPVNNSAVLQFAQDVNAAPI